MCHSLCVTGEEEGEADVEMEPEPTGVTPMDTSSDEPGPAAPVKTKKRIGKLVDSDSDEER